VHEAQWKHMKFKLWTTAVTLPPQWHWVIAGLTHRSSYFFRTTQGSGLVWICVGSEPGGARCTRGLQNLNTCHHLLGEVGALADGAFPDARWYICVWTMNTYVLAHQPVLMNANSLPPRQWKYLKLKMASKHRSLVRKRPLFGLVIDLPKYLMNQVKHLNHDFLRRF